MKMLRKQKLRVRQASEASAGPLSRTSAIVRPIRAFRARSQRSAAWCSVRRPCPRPPRRRWMDEEHSEMSTRATRERGGLQCPPCPGVRRRVLEQRDAASSTRKRGVRISPRPNWLRGLPRCSRDCPLTARGRSVRHADFDSATAVRSTALRPLRLAWSCAKALLSVHARASSSTRSRRLSQVLTLRPVSRAARPRPATSASPRWHGSPLAGERSWRPSPPSCACY